MRGPGWAPLAGVTLAGTATFGSTCGCCCPCCAATLPANPRLAASTHGNLGMVFPPFGAILPSVDFHAGVLHQLRPLGDIFAHEFSELVGRHGHRHCTLLAPVFLHVGSVEHLVHLGAQALV